VPFSLKWIVYRFQDKFQKVDKPKRAKVVLEEQAIPQGKNHNSGGVLQ
jgi:hypothetical protein